MAATARGHRVAEMVEERRQQYREESRRNEQEDGLKKGNKNREERVRDGTQQAITAAGARQEEQKNRSPEWAEEGSAIYPPASDTERRLYEIIDKWVDAAERIMCAKFELEDEIKAKDALLRATGDKILGSEAEIAGQERHIKSLEPEEFKNDHPDMMGTLEALAAAFDEGFEKGRPLENKLETNENSPEELNELIQIAKRVYIAPGCF